MGYKEDIREVIVQHVGKENAIYNREIAEAVGIDEGDTYSRTRRYLKEVLKDGVPIASSPAYGNWIVANQEELDNYVGRLGRQARQIDNRRLLVIDAAENWPELDLPPEPEGEFYE